MAATKIGEPIAEGIAEAAEYHYGAFTNDGKFWLVGRKGLRQDTFSYYHRVAYNGGYVVAFDTTTKKWGEKKAFTELSADENMEDEVFAVGRHLLMLLYSRFNDFKLHGLYEWQQDKGCWHKIDQFKVDSEVEQEGRQRSELTVVSEPHGPFLVVSSDTVSVGKLTVSESDSGNITGAEVSFIMTLDPDVVPWHGPSGHVVNGGVYRDRLVLMGGSHGCGFRWTPREPTLVNLATRVAKKVEMTDASDVPDSGTCPPFGYSGSSATATLADGRWLHITGSRAKGMTGSEYSGEVWQMKLNGSGEDLHWEKTPAAFPLSAPEGRVVAVDTEGGRVFVADHKTGVFEAKL